MIDLHSHIIYGIDDGTRTLTEAIELGKMAATGGTTVMAATPHGPGSTASRIYETELIVERATEIEAALQAAGVALRIVPSTEISFHSGVVGLLRSGLLLPYAGTHTVLLEPTYGFPISFDTIVFEIQALGYRVLLAHPERVPEVQADPNRLATLIERGVLMQLTAEAITGNQGERMQKLAETLLTHNLIHVVASDTHRPNLRPPSLVPAHNHAAALIGEAAADALFNATPAALLANQPVIPAPPKPVRRR